MRVERRCTRLVAVCRAVDEVQMLRHVAYRRVAAIGVTRQADLLPRGDFRADAEARSEATQVVVGDEITVGFDRPKLAKLLDLA